jgi:hypothetical protein
VASGERRGMARTAPAKESPNACNGVSEDELCCVIDRFVENWGAAVKSN